MLRGLFLITDLNNWKKRATASQRTKVRTTATEWKTLLIISNPINHMILSSSTQIRCLQLTSRPKIKPNISQRKIRPQQTCTRMNLSHRMGTNIHWSRIPKTTKPKDKNLSDLLTTKQTKRRRSSMKNCQATHLSIERLTKRLSKTKNLGS